MNVVRWIFTPEVDAGGGLRVAVLDVEAPTVLAALEATRATWEAFPLRVLDAPKGGGKTFALARVVGERAVCVNDRKALAAQIAERFGAELRREPGSTSRAVRHQAENAPRLTVTLHTTPRLVGRDVSRDTLVVDEAIHVLRTLATGPELAGQRRGEVYEALLSLVVGARDGWFAQASWEMSDVARLARLLDLAGRRDRLLYVVVRTPEARGPATEIGSPEALRAAAIDAATVGPTLYASTTRAGCEVVAEDARRLGLDPLVVSARTVHRERVRRWLAAPRADAEQFVLISPTIVSGLSIDVRADGSPEYADVFLEARHWPGGLALDDELQIVARVRGRPRLAWYAPRYAIEVRSAADHATDAENLALASARLARVALRAPTGLDELGASCAAATQASHAPTPRDALLAGLLRDGWTLTGCDPTEASPDERKRWSAAKIAAGERYVAELADGDRGPVDQATVDARLGELGLPATTGPLDDTARAAVAWLERDHRGRTPLRLLAALLEPEQARSRDRDALAAALARTDLPHETARVELARALFRAANFDLARFVRGGMVDVRSTDLGGFTSACFRYRREVLRLLGIEAPKGRGGAVRAFSSLVDRIAGERAGSRRPAGSERVRVYAFRLAPAASACLARRYGAVVPVPVEAPGEVFARTPEDVLRARVPLRVLPEAAERVAAIEARSGASDDAKERARLGAAVEAVKAAIPATGGDTLPAPRPTDYLLSAARCTRDDAGRIYLKDAPLQTLPKAIRDVIVPELPGDVFVSADIGSCHLAVAAARMGDGALADLAASGAAYERLGEQLLPGVPDARAKVKGAVLALLNGAGATRIGAIIGAPTRGASVRGALLRELPGLGAALDQARREYARPGPVTEVRTLSGAVRRVRKNAASKERRVLSAMWSAPEAEAIDHALVHLPLGARLAAPMHDGLLVCCPREDAGRVADELRATMVAGTSAAGFRARVKVGVGETWAAAEKAAA